MIQIEALLPELCAYARSVAGNREDAEDLVQDVVERALRAKSLPGPLNELRPWMFRVIRNLNVDELRKRRVRMEYSSTQSRLSTDLAQSQDHAEAVAVRMTFKTLPPQMREVLFLVDVIGMKYAEAAEIMNVPHGTVMSRVSRARKALIEAMQAGLDRANEVIRKEPMNVPGFLAICHSLPPKALVLHSVECWGCIRETNDTAKIFRTESCFFECQASSPPGEPWDLEIKGRKTAGLAGLQPGIRSAGHPLPNHRLAPG